MCFLHHLWGGGLPLRSHLNLLFRGSEGDVSLEFSRPLSDIALLRCLLCIGVRIVCVKTFDKDVREFFVNGIRAPVPRRVVFGHCQRVRILKLHVFIRLP